MILRPAVGLLLGKLLGRCVEDLIGDADGLSKGEFEGMVVSIKVGPLDNVLVGIFDGLNDITVGCSEEMIKDIIDVVNTKQQYHTIPYHTTTVHHLVNNLD